MGELIDLINEIKNLNKNVSRIANAIEKQSDAGIHQYITLRNKRDEERVRITNDTAVITECLYEIASRL